LNVNSNGADDDHKYQREQEELAKATAEIRSMKVNYSKMVREMYWPKVSVKK
jgi:hypothetical protein